LTQDKAIHLQNKPLIPRDIIESDLSLQSYLEQNIIDNRQDEKTRLRIAKAKQTWTNKKLEAAARKIKVEPSTDSESNQKTTGPGITQQQQKTWRCKKVETEKSKVIACNKSEKPSEPLTKEPTEGSLVTEQRKGIVVVCHNCAHKFVHHSKNLSRQYYCTCSRCKSNIRLKHYK